LVTHARDIWWTLDFANAFVSPGVNSRGELVPSHSASRRRLGDNRYKDLISTNYQRQLLTINNGTIYVLFGYSSQNDEEWNSS
jgi:hypothetical protein